jgi:hypothetical protein
VTGGGFLRKMYTHGACASRRVWPETSGAMARLMERTLRPVRSEMEA